METVTETRDQHKQPSADITEQLTVSEKEDSKGKEKIPVDEGSNDDEENDSDILIYKELIVDEPELSDSGEENDELLMSSEMYLGFPVTLEFGKEYLMFNLHPNELNDRWNQTPVLISRPDGIYGKMESFFPLIRDGFFKINEMVPMEYEVVLEWPDLGLVLGEDNVYNNEVSFSDIVSLFNQLNLNTMEAHRRRVMSIKMSLNNRFSSQYNDILDLINSHKGFTELQEQIENRNDPELINLDNSGKHQLNKNGDESEIPLKKIKLS